MSDRIKKFMKIIGIGMLIVPAALIFILACLGFLLLGGTIIEQSHITWYDSDNSK